MHQQWPHAPRPSPNTFSRSAHRPGVSGAIWICGGRGELMARDIRPCLAVCSEPSRPGLWIGDLEPNGDRLGRSRQVNLPERSRRSAGRQASARCPGALRLGPHWHVLVFRSARAHGAILMIQRLYDSIVEHVTCQSRGLSRAPIRSRLLTSTPLRVNRQARPRPPVVPARQTSADGGPGELDPDQPTAGWITDAPRCAPSAPGPGS